MDVQTDREPEQNRFIRSDQYSFIRNGIPSLAFKFGYEAGSPEEKIRREWVRDRYHKPSDDLSQPVDQAAAALFNHVIANLLRARRGRPRAPALEPGQLFQDDSQSDFPDRETEHAPDARHVPHRGPPVRFHHAGIFLWHGPALETFARRARRAAGESSGARPGLRHRRFFEAGRKLLSRRASGGGRSHRADAATGARRGIRQAVCADACVLPFTDEAFDCVFIGYGLRNFPDLEQAVSEIRRVTRPGGKLVSLDFFLPANRLMRCLYLGYLYAQGAFWGTVLHGSPRVYTYIPDSLRSFVSIDGFSECLRSAGYRRIESRKHILGGIGLHWAQ